MSGVTPPPAPESPAVGSAPESVVGLAAAIRSGRSGALAALTRSLDRMRAGGLNAVVTPDPGAEAAARAADRAVAGGAPLGPLHGVPFTVKDTIDVAGLPATAGSRALAGRVPDRTATAVRRLRAAGAVLVGKTNCSEFAVAIHTDNPRHGPTLNPVDRSRTPGGSSGGDAAAVAGGVVPFGLGTDLGGSLRWPAHCTGVCALRPTVGLLPGDGVLPHTGGPPDTARLPHQLMTVGPLAGTVADLALLLEVLAGPGAPRPGPVDPAGLRVAWCAGDGAVAVDPEVADALAAAADALRPRVAGLERRRPPGLDECAELFVALRDADGLPQVRELVAGREGSLGGELAGYLAGLPRVSPTARAALARRRDTVRAGVLSFLANWPVLLLPVASVPAPRPGATVVVGGEPVEFGRLGSCCRAISVLGLPAAAVPVGRSRDGLPIGAQVVGRPGHEHEVLAVAALLEAR